MPSFFDRFTPRPILLATLCSALLGVCRVDALAAVIDKRVVFLRHGQTYMNEYLGTKPFGSPMFSDVFPKEQRRKYYQDSPLSSTGVRQAQALSNSQPSFLKDCELIVTSPLRRALQTAHIGLKPHSTNSHIPMLALPEAAERLYLVSDIGRPCHEIKKEYSYVDFETGFKDKSADAWWYQSSGKPYKEWRPSGQGQQYACPGEPDDHFAARMTRLYEFLENRPESRIAVVCHWGVIDAMLDMDFENCHWREVALSEVRQRVLQGQS